MTAVPDLAAWLREGHLEFLKAARELDIEGEAIARCEAELAILDLHKPIDVPGMAWRGCATCKDPVTRWPKTHPCRTVRLLGSGYKHRDGYLGEWKP